MELHERRRLFFIKEGLPEDDAFELANRVKRRDSDPLDDRKLCFECANYRKNKTCLKRLDRKGIPQSCLPFILQRCEDFRGKK